MNLVVDIGNTFVKAALFQHNELVSSVHERRTDSQRFSLFAQQHSIEACAVSCVVQDTSDIGQWLNSLQCPIIYVDGTTLVPFHNAYRTPLTLGSDRIAALAGAITLFPQQDILIADIGTCLTLDVLTHDGTFLGGNISLGPSMRLQALHEGTARLPLVNHIGDTPLIGYNTETAIRSGVMQGLSLEIEGYAQRLRQTMPQLKVLLTGGKSTEILPLLSPSLQLIHQPHLVETGLNAILNYNNATSCQSPSQ